MKKLTSVLCALSLLILASSFTPPKDDTVSAKIKSAFEKTFTSASDVSWKKSGGFYLAYFKIDNQSFSAAYNENGDLLSASRSITLSQLPLNVNFALQHKFEGYTLDNAVTEINVDGLSNYYIKAE